MFFRYKTKFISDIEQKNRKLLVNIAVAPFVGVWIEIRFNGTNGVWLESVAPCVGVWIEIIIFYLVWVILIFINCHQYCSNDKRIYIQWKHKKGRNQ